MRRIPIVQGEHAAINVPDTVIATLLGSCIAVCLHDAEAHVGGMNHFLLGEPGEGHAPRAQDMQRYGVHAMELLINAMMQRGASRRRLRAHIYGGATIIAGLGGIGASNAAFAQRFVRDEGIAIGHVDVGGTMARKIEFMPYEGRTRTTLVNDPVPLPPVRKAPQPAPRRRAGAFLILPVMATRFMHQILTPADRPLAPLQGAIACELRQVRGMLEALAEVLVGDAYFVATFMDQLQAFDLMVQCTDEAALVLDRLADGLAPDAAIAPVRLDAIRMRLATALAKAA